MNTRCVCHVSQEAKQDASRWVSMGSGERNAVDIEPLSTPSPWALPRWALSHNRMSL